MAHLRKGQKVAWTWGAHSAEGRVAETFTDDVTRRIKGAEVKRHATPEEPAYLVRQQDGSRVLKSESELKGKS